MSGPTPATKLEARIIYDRQYEFLMDITQVSEPKSLLTNIRIVDKGHA